MVVDKVPSATPKKRALPLGERAGLWHANIQWREICSHREILKAIPEAKIKNPAGRTGRGT